MIKKIKELRFFSSLKIAIGKHKFISFILLLLVVFGGYRAYGALFPKAVETRYVTEAAAKQTLVVSISGTGQVAVLDQVEIKPKVSGDLVYVGIKNGQEVMSGALLVKIDTYEAQKAVGDAEIALAQERLTLEKMTGLTNADGTIRGDREKALDNLEKAYEDGFNTIANVFLDLPTIMAGLQDILYGHSFGISGQWNIDYYLNGIQSTLGKMDYEALRFRDSADTAYQSARILYDITFSDYKSASRFSDRILIEKLIDQTYETTKLVAEASKNASNFIQYYKDKLLEYNVKPNSLADTHLSQINGHTSKTNSHLLSLLSLETNIQNYKEAIVNVGFSFSDQQIRVRQAERTLTDAKQRLAECYVYAPFSGVIASVNVKRGDAVSSGSSLATLITKQKIAELSLNEIDAARVKFGAKTTLTFDAVADLSITGEVGEVETLGTVSQGVVSYAIQVVFDTQDERVKPGMSVTASIITDIRSDVLAVPNGAIKARNGTAYVEFFDTVPESSGSSGFVSAVPPREQIVQTGAENDDYTEILSGVTEGQHVVVRTITSETTTQTAQTNGTSASRLLIGGSGVRR